MRFSACMMSLLFIMVMMCFSMKADDSDVLQNNDGKRTVVDYFGFIHVKGNKIVDQNDTPVALHGMSLFWSQWGDDFTMQTVSDGCEMIGSVPLSELSAVFNLMDILKIRKQNLRKYQQ